MIVPNSDRITIGLYSLQTDEGFDTAFLKEIPNILTIKKNFDSAAKLAGRNPPGIVISLFLIPAWAKGSDFNNATYKRIEKAMMETFVKKLNEPHSHLSGINVELFYSKTEKEEKDYLERLTSKGSCADMIKTHAIIDKDNGTRRHLQLDSNTQIHNFAGLYNSTFGASIQQDCIALNASYYDIDYVSAHNKIVYTVPHSDFITKLRKVHLDYCKAHANDHLVQINQDEKSKKNSIYARDFVVALEQMGLTRPVELIGGGYERPRKIYPAVLERTEAYRLTTYVVTAVNRSWDIELPHSLQINKELPSVRVGDTLCDYASFVAWLKST